MAKRYIAGRRLNLGTRVADIGDPVPEAADWKNLGDYISMGHIKVEEGDYEDSPAEVEAEIVNEEESPDYGSMTVADLREIAKKLKVKGRTTLAKDQLIAAIEEAEAGDEEE